MIPTDDDDDGPDMTDEEIGTRLLYFAAVMSLVVLAVVMAP